MAPPLSCTVTLPAATATGYKRINVSRNICRNHQVSTLKGARSIGPAEREGSLNAHLLNSGAVVAAGPVSGRLLIPMTPKASDGNDKISRKTRKTDYYFDKKVQIT